MTARTKLVVLLSVTILIHAVLLCVTRDPVLEGDAAHYDKLGWSVAQGKGLELWGHQTASRPPLYPLFVGGAYSLFGHDPAGAKLLQIIPALLTVVLAFAIGRDLFGDTVGLLTAAVVSFYPEMVGLRLLLWSETWFTFWVTMSIWAVIRAWRRPNTTSLILLGACIGVASVTRSPGVSLLIAAIAFLLLQKTFANVREALKAISIISAVAALLIAPWAIRNWIVLGQPVTGDTYMGQALYTGHSKLTPLLFQWKAMDAFDRDPVILSLQAQGITMEGDEIAYSNALYSIAVHNIVSEPALFLLRLPGKILDFWGPERFVAAQCREGALGEGCVGMTYVLAAVTNVAYLLLLVLAVWGLVLVRRKPEGNLGIVLVVAYMSMFVVTYGGPRYRLPLVPLLAVCASIGMMEVSSHWPFSLLFKNRREEHVVTRPSSSREGI